MRTIKEWLSEIDKADNEHNPSRRADLADALVIELRGIFGTDDRLTEICQAERDGRLVILPCKVGDAVYVISNEPCPYNCKHQYRNDGQFNIWHKENNNNCKQCEYIDKKYIWEREFYLDDLARVDKTVFFTREEAEQVLSKGGAKR